MATLPTGCRLSYLNSTAIPTIMQIIAELDPTAALALHEAAGP